MLARGDDRHGTGNNVRSERGRRGANERRERRGGTETGAARRGAEIAAGGAGVVMGGGRLLTAVAVDGRRGDGAGYRAERHRDRHRGRGDAQEQGEGESYPPETGREHGEIVTSRRACGQGRDGAGPVCAGLPPVFKGSRAVSSLLDLALAVRRPLRMLSPRNAQPAANRGAAPCQPRAHHPRHRATPRDQRQDMWRHTGPN
jgi:hypothetical protein